MESIDKLLDRCEQTHGHLCAGQLLGVRMAYTVHHGPVCQSCAFGAYYQTEATMKVSPRANA